MNYVFYDFETSGRSSSWDQINALIVARTKEGKNVVRLKGGDPMIFGRGGEEAAELAYNRKGVLRNR